MHSLHFRRMRNLAFFLPMLMAACFPPIDMTDSPCPCVPGFQCCPALNVCRPLASACAPSDGGFATTDGGGVDAGAGAEGLVGLQTLPYRTDELGTSGVVLSSMTTPAALVSRGDAVYVLTAVDPGCTGTPSGFAVSRFEVAPSGLTLSWSTQLPSGIVRGNLHVSDAGVTVVGTGALEGQPLQGGLDALVLRIRHDGSLAWVRQFGTIFEDSGTRPLRNAVYVNGADNVVVLADGTTVVAGTTRGSLSGQPAKGGRDVFVAQLATDGTLGWVRLFGSTNDDDVSVLLGLEDGTVVLGGRTDGVIEPGYVKTQTAESFLVRLSASGVASSTKQLRFDLTQGSVQRWEDDLALVGGQLELVRVSIEGEVRFEGDWVTDAGKPDDFDFVPLDGGFGAFHGLVNLIGMLVPPWPFELIEHVWSADGGVSVTPSSGGWPQVGARLSEYPLIGHGPDGTSYVAGGSMIHRQGFSNVDNLVTLTRQEPMGLRRDELHQWLFDQPPVLQVPEFFLANIHPTRLTVVENGSRVMMGEVKWSSCRAAQRIWLMRL